MVEAWQAQAAAEAEAALESRRDLQVSLAAETARDYLELRGAQERMRRNRLAEEVKQNQQALFLVRQQYEHGLADFINVLDAERTMLSSQDEFDVSNVLVTTDLVALYKSLGGGWD